MRYQVIVQSASVSSRASNLTAINSNVNSCTAHYTDGWRGSFSCHSSSHQWVSGNTTCTILPYKTNWSRAAPTKTSQCKRGISNPRSSQGPCIASSLLFSGGSHTTMWCITATSLLRVWTRMSLTHIAAGRACSKVRRGSRQE
ncbi:hypothetical protein ATANTOWER_012111 [Ataeniobius toweri]|uniref:Uncharacterized protein n=1 Tax=Ataeniobius toweri TaxID=208326 RepID=A0ABU7A6J1_9TELE|nr:hypothetical protein [Ataeniobius toweri]